MRANSTDERPLVSIITPSRNHGEFLEDSIQSVLAQDYHPLEHIVVDSASTDGTVGILKRYPHLIWVSEPDRSPEEAIAKGHRLARGQIINHMMADDRMASPRVVSTMVAALLRHEGARWAYGDWATIDRDGRLLLDLKSRQVDYPYILRHCQDIHGIVFPTCFFRRELFEELGELDPALRPPSDIEIHLRFARRHPPLYVPVTVLEFRRHPGSYSTNHTMIGLVKLAQIVARYARDEDLLAQVSITAHFVKCSLFVTILPVFVKTVLGERQLHRMIALKARLERLPVLGSLLPAVLGH